jgi:hypothetical protein
LLVDIGDGRGGSGIRHGDRGEGEGEEKGPKLHEKNASGLRIGGEMGS